MGQWIILVIGGKIDFAELSLREHNQLGNGMPSDSDVINQILGTSLSLFLETSMQEQAIKHAPCSERGITAHSSLLWIEENLKAFVSLPQSDSNKLELIRTTFDNLMNGFDRQK